MSTLPPPAAQPVRRRQAAIGSFSTIAKHIIPVWGSPWDEAPKPPPLSEVGVGILRLSAFVETPIPDRGLVAVAISFLRPIAYPANRSLL